MTTAQIELSPKLIPVFQGAARYRGAYGGRGGGKTRPFALMTAVHGYRCGMAGISGQIVCGREYQNSLEDSSMEEIKIAIRSEPWLNAYYEIGEKFIRSKDGRIKYTFCGLRYNLDSIKSKARILLLWADEAEAVSEVAWRKVIPTVREANSEIWLTWNPESPESATHKRFRETIPSDSKIIEVNYTDNPWFPEVLDAERLRDLERDPDTYGHIWEGEFLTRTDAQVFGGKWEVKAFAAHDKEGKLRDGWVGPYQGVDFGFSADPLSAHRYWLHDDTLYCEYEAYKVGVEMDHTVAFINRNIPDFAKYVSRADSAEPKTISYLQRHGFPKMEGVKKWPNSVEEGIRFIRKYKKVIVHPRCTGAISNMRLYSHKIDKNTDDVLPDIVDANNHMPDDMRYAIAPIIKAQNSGKMVIRI